VENYGLFAGQVATMKVTGLNLSMKYNFTLFGSLQAGGDVNTGYTINGKTALLNCSYNQNGTVTLYDIEPNANGEVVITIAPGTSSSQFGLLSAVVIDAFVPAAASTPAPPARTTVSPEIVSAQQKEQQGNVVSTDIYPNPFTEYFNLTITSAAPEQLKVVMYDMSGKMVYQNQFGNITKGMNSIRVQPQSELTPGVYMVKAILGNREIRSFKVIRK
jgi:hypothetical protein